MEPEQDKVLPLDAPAEPDEKLPYRLELRAADGDTVERVLARAMSAALAQAMFQAALTEYPGRRLTLRRGSRVIAESAGE